MRRVLIFASAALLGGATLTTVASAHEGGEDLHFLAKVTSVEKEDLGDGGRQVVVNFDLFEHDHEGDGDVQSSGDETQGQGSEAQGDGAEALGHGVAVCVTADAGAGVLCSGNIMVDEGQISSQGSIHIPSHKAASAHGEGEGDGGGGHSVLLPVTGGSGDFIGAAGELEISHAGTDGGQGGGGGMEMHASGTTPVDHPKDGEGGGGGHGALHLLFHLEG